MTSAGGVWVGADPGGLGNFGVAIIRPDGLAQTWCVDCADEAVSVITEQIAPPPNGAGVDAPLWWSSGVPSSRLADRWLRETYGLSGGNVQSVNSLQGAALAQGMMFVQRLREHYGSVAVTETHPKAVLKALRLSWPEFLKRFSVSTRIGNASEHERDAVIGAVAAREGFQGRWQNDLSINRDAAEQDPRSFWLAPIHYFWP